MLRISGAQESGRVGRCTVTDGSWILQFDDECVPFRADHYQRKGQNAHLLIELFSTLLPFSQLDDENNHVEVEECSLASTVSVVLSVCICIDTIGTRLVKQETLIHRLLSTEPKPSV